MLDGREGLTTALTEIVPRLPLAVPAVETVEIRDGGARNAWFAGVDAGGVGGRCG